MPEYVQEKLKKVGSRQERIEILRDHATVLRYDLRKVLSMVRYIKERGAAKLGGLEGRIVNNILEIQEQHLTKRGDPSSIYNLEQTIHYLNLLQKTVSKVHKEIFDARGYILSLDPLTAGLTEGGTSRDLVTYTRIVRENVKMLIMNLINYKRWLKAISLNKNYLKSLT